MRLASFIIITVLSLLYVGLAVAETALYQTWDREQKNQKNVQAEIAQFGRVNDRIRQLLQRMAYDSQRDPALAKLLKEHGLKVVVTTPQPMTDTTPPSGNETAPAITPAAPAPSHP